MARERIGDTGAELDPSGTKRHRRHVDIGFTPDEMGIADPDVAVTQLFSHLGELHHLRQRFGGKEPYPKFKITHNEFLQSHCGRFINQRLSATKSGNLTTGLTRHPLGRRRLLATAGDSDFTVDDDCRDTRKIALGKGFQSVLGYRAGYLVQQD
jgi:hypothetical protein